MGRPQGSKSESGYQILSEAQADSLFREIRSRNADIDTIQQFFLKNSFYLKKVQALTERSRVACIAFYTRPGGSERLGILAVRARGDAVEQTIAGLLWIESGSGFANEIEGPKVPSTSPTSLVGLWNCVFNSGSGMYCSTKCTGPRTLSRAADRVACLEASCGFPFVYFWFRRCY